MFLLSVVLSAYPVKEVTRAALSSSLIFFPSTYVRMNI
jgi:hypothetical protein